MPRTLGGLTLPCLSASVMMSTRYSALLWVEDSGEAAEGGARHTEKRTVGQGGSSSAW